MVYQSTLSFAVTGQQQRNFLSAARAGNLLDLQTMYQSDPELLDVQDEYSNTALHCVVQTINSWQEFEPFYRKFHKYWYEKGHFRLPGEFQVSPVECLFAHYLDDIPEDILVKLCAEREKIHYISGETKDKFFDALPILDKDKIVDMLDKEPQLLLSCDKELNTPLYHLASCCACWPQFEYYYKLYEKQWWQHNAFFTRDQRGYAPLHYLFKNCKERIPDHFLDKMVKHCPFPEIANELISLAGEINLPSLQEKLEGLFQSRQNKGGGSSWQIVRSR